MSVRWCLQLGCRHRYAGIYSGPTYLIAVVGYLEDGILHIYAEAGYPGPHATHPAPHVGARTTGGISGNTLTRHLSVRLYSNRRSTSYPPAYTSDRCCADTWHAWRSRNLHHRKPRGVSIAASIPQISINGGTNYLLRVQSKAAGSASNSSTTTPARLIAPQHRAPRPSASRLRALTTRSPSRG